jgi:hypothetical protein
MEQKEQKFVPNALRPTAWEFIHPKASVRYFFNSQN